MLRLTEDGPVVVDAEREIGVNELVLAYVRSNLDATRTDKGHTPMGKSEREEPPLDRPSRGHERSR